MSIHMKDRLIESLAKEGQLLKKEKEEFRSQGAVLPGCVCSFQGQG
jgi:hypothetical protein